MMELAEMTTLFNDLNGWLVALLALTATIGIFGKKTWKVLKWIFNLFKKMDAYFDTIVGREAVLHPDTGKVLVPASLPIGPRLAVIEEQQAKTQETLQLLAENQQQLVLLEGGIQKLEERWQKSQEEGQAIIQEWTDWRDEWHTSKQTEHERLWEAINALR